MVNWPRQGQRQRGYIIFFFLFWVAVTNLENPHESIQGPNSIDSVMVILEMQTLRRCRSSTPLAMALHPEKTLTTVRNFIQNRRDGQLTWVTHVQGIAMGLSSLSTAPLEEVVAAAQEIGDISHVLQLYVMKNRRASERLVRRAESMSTYFICILRH